MNLWLLLGFTFGVGVSDGNYEVVGKESLKIKFGKPGQWTPHPSQIANWQAYLKTMERDYAKLFRDPKGTGGFDPPPWAKFEKAYGKPDYCFLPPAPGNCQDVHLKIQEERWGYNPFKDVCEVFKFSGCDGNANNFMTKKICEQGCKKRPKTCCNEGIAALNRQNKKNKNKG